MQISYQKPGKDHPMYGKVDFIVADGSQPLCYKTENGYLPLENAGAAAIQAAEPKVETKPLYVLSFKINDEPEEMTFTSKKQHDKAKAALEAKGYVTDLKTTTYQVLV